MSAETVWRLKVPGAPAAPPPPLVLSQYSAWHACNAAPGTWLSAGRWRTDQCRLPQSLIVVHGIAGVSRRAAHRPGA
eukprot:2347537-Prymnesium_polylepis.1